MLTIRKAADRGRTQTDWLDSAHSFAFGGYRDPHHPGFRNLRVINEDHIAPGGGFGAHPHAEMEILTWVIDGALLHRDSTGNDGAIRAGEAQRMTAGTGVVHSEHNASETDPVHLLQIWAFPAESGLAPGYDQKRFADAGFGLTRIADRAGRDGALHLAADLAVHAGTVEPGSETVLPLAADRHGWLQLVSGRGAVNGVALEAGDGLAVGESRDPEFSAGEAAHFLWFELD
jgi:redox-sensitive bicupin YhaK (pirin superfamily)